MCQSCPTLCDPVNCGLPGSSIHGTLQARILECIAISFSRGSSPSRDQNQVSRIAGRCFNLWATREAHIIHVKNIIWYLSFSVWFTSLSIIISRSKQKGWKSSLCFQLFRWMYGKCHCGDSSAKLRRNVSDKPATLKEHEFIVHFWNFKVKVGESKKVIVIGKKLNLCLSYWLFWTKMFKLFF